MPVLQPETVREVKLQPPYHVVLLNDDDHTYEYVIEMLGRFFGYSRERAFQMAREVDASGPCIVYPGPFERAEFKQDQIHAFGADGRIPHCQGSMSAELEPAEA